MSDVLGPVEFAVLSTVSRGGLRSRCIAKHVCLLREQPCGEALLHEALRRCESDGLLSSNRDSSGRRYELTAAGRAKLHADRQFRAALAQAMARSRY